MKGGDRRFAGVWVSAVWFSDLHAIPEEPRREQVGGRVCVQEAGCRAEDLGDLRVGVRAGEVVLMALERLEERAVLELDRKSVVEGKRGDLGGRRIIKKKK